MQNSQLEENKQSQYEYIQQDEVQSPEKLKTMEQQDIEENIYKEYLYLQTKSRIRDNKFNVNDVLNIKNEDKQFMILNRDSGELFDIRNGEIIQNLFNKNQYFQNVKIDLEKEKNIWKDFWNNLNKIHEQLINAVIDGDLQKLQDILLKQTLLYPIDINIKEFDNMTPLHYAALEGNTECAKFLIEQNANIEAQTKFMRRPIHLCALRDNIELTDLLISKGSDLDCQDKEFNTPLHLATENGFIDIIDLLLSKKAKSNIKNYQGLTPYEITSNEQIQEIFKKYGVFFQNVNSYNKQRKDFIDKVTQNSKSNQQAGSRTSSINSRSSSIAQNNMLNKQLKRTDVEILQKITQDDFDYFKVLGKGAFGKVYLVRRKNNNEDVKFYAMKMLEKERIKNNNLVRYAKVEKNVMKVMDHPFIVKLKYTFQTQNGLFLVMQFCPGGDVAKLLDKYDKLDEQTSKIYVAEVLLALEALHRQNIIFRDLKPANILIDEEGHALLADFGLANQKEDHDIMRKSFCGTPAYLAPEMVKKVGHNRMIDWYLLGVFLYECLTGVTPYYANNKEELFNLILKGPLKLPSKSISQEAKDIIVALLNRNPEKRLGYERDAEEIKEHPFFADINWNDLYNRKYKINIQPDWCKIPECPQDLNIPQRQTDIIDVEDWSFVDSESQEQYQQNSNSQKIKFNNMQQLLKQSSKK